ncbi:hypothetical protein CMK14_02855, partial [Candidatus Poribacteria bacterium]|nr:hypothetical protein [Candidatus Poribacteria bacterium]
LNEISLLDGSAPIDLGKFRELLQEELENEDSRKAALQGLIEEIVAHPDYTGSQISNRKKRSSRTYLLPPRVTVRPRRSKPRQLQLTPILQHGSTFQLESKTQAAQPIYAGLG